MKRINFISGVLVGCMFFQSSAFAAKKSECKVLVNESFNEYVTNSIPGGFDIPESGYARVIANEEKNNKCLMVKSQSGIVNMEFAFNKQAAAAQTDEDSMLSNIVSSVSLRGEKCPPTVTIGYYDATLLKNISFITVKGGKICLYNGQKIGGINPAKDTRIAIAYDLLKGTFSVFINGRKTVSDWKLPDGLENPSKLTVSTFTGSDEGIVYIDDIRVYTGSEENTKISSGTYNETEVEAVEVAEEIGNARFMDSDFENEANPLMGFYPIMDKANKVRVDYDKQTDNHYLYIDKILTADPFLDVQIQSGPKHLVSEMDIKVTKPGAKICPWYVRDNMTVSGTNMDESPVYVMPNMALTCCGINAGKLQKDKWHHIAAAFNILTRTMDLYLDGEKVVENRAFTSKNMKQFNLVRITLMNGADMGDACVDNFRVYEGTGPVAISNNDEYVSIYADGKAYQNMLKDRVAVHGYAGSAFKDNEKIMLANSPIIDDNETVFVEKSDIEMLFGGIMPANAASIEKDGKTYIDFDAYCKDTLKKETYNDGSGLIIAGDNQLSVAEAKQQLLNDYMFYQRPTAEEIAADFDKKNPIGTEHPRILASKEDFDRIRGKQNFDDVMEKWYNTQMSAANGLVNDPKPVTYYLPDGIRLLETCRVVLHRMESLGFAYQMTGDKKYSDRAWLELQTIFDFPDWNPGHMLDTGEMTAAVGIAYDWMYDAFTEEQKAEIVKQIKEKGLSLIRDAHYGRLLTSGGIGRSDKFATWKSNFNTVINGGGVLGALAIAENDRDFCFDLVEKSIRSLEYVMPLFIPDGGWEEGVMYWGYNMSYLEKFVGSLDSAVGTDFGIMKFKGLKKTAMYPISLETWIGQNNFHDAGSAHITAGSISWLADKFGNDSIMRWRKFAYQKFNSNFSVYDLIYYDPIKANGAVDAPLDWYTRGIESCTSRAAYDDKEGLVYSAHGGPTTCYHSQYDTGTFIFELLGVRWGIDLGADSYTTSTPATQLYKKRPEGHNTIVINPNEETGQLPNTNSPVVRFESKPKGSICVYDMTEPYSQNANKVLRGFLVGDERRGMTVRDEIDLKNSNSDIYWFMQTEADVEITDNGAVLRQDDRELRLEYKTNASKSEITVTDAIALPSSPHPEEDKTKFPGIHRIAIKLTGSGKVNLAVKLSSLDDVNTGIDDKAISDWTIPDGDIIKRESIKANMIYRDGKPMVGFDQDVTSYEVMLNEGDAKPAITVEAGDKPTDIEDRNGKTVISVYSDAGKTFKRTYSVAYSYVKPLPELAGYKRLTAAGLTVGSTPEPINKGSNMLDGIIDTRWTTFTNLDEAVFDLGEIKRIDNLGISFWKSETRSYLFDILVSENGADYTPILKDGKTDGITPGMQLLNINPVNARYIKLVCGGNNENVNTNIQEFAILQRP